MGVGISGLVGGIYRERKHSMMNLNASKKNPKKYVDASTIPTVLTLLAISEDVSVNDLNNFESFITFVEIS
jgi:hypothetical protein